MPDEPEVHGLLAMMLLLDARREARFSGRRDGAARRPGPLAAGTPRRSPPGGSMLDRALALRGRGPYVVQAAIASLHADEPRDWAADRRPVRRARPPHRLAGRRVEPGRRGRRGARDRRPGSRSSTASRSRTTATCTRRAASCCAASAAPPRPATPTAARWRWSTTTPSGACSNGRSPSSVHPEHHPAPCVSIVEAAVRCDRIHPALTVTAVSPPRTFR